MAVLPTVRRQLLRAEFGRRVSERREAFALTKAQLDAAIAATDDWIEANATAFNNALPVAARNNLTASQKTELFHLVAVARYGG